MKRDILIPVLVLVLAGGLWYVYQQSSQDKGSVMDALPPEVYTDQDTPTEPTSSDPSENDVVEPESGEYKNEALGFSLQLPEKYQVFEQGSELLYISPAPTEEQGASTPVASVKIKNSTLATEVTKFSEAPGVEVKENEEVIRPELMGRKLEVIFPGMEETAVFYFYETNDRTFVLSPWENANWPQFEEVAESFRAL